MSTQPDLESPAQSPIAAVIVLCFGGLSAAMSQTLIIPIQGDLPRLLDTSPGNAGWVVTITLLAAAVAMPTAGRLADLFGKQRVLLVSALILLAGSILCALSDALAPMLAGRALQGLAMGFIPVGISLMREITPPHLTSTAIAAMSATMGVGGAIGLPLSAWIADSNDWHALFWVATGLAVLMTVGAVVAVPHIHDGSTGHFDVIGAMGLTIGLVSFLVGVSKGNEWGWSDSRTVGSIVVGLVALLLWGAFELRQAEPLVDLRATAHLPVLLTNVAGVAIGFGMMAQSVVVPQLLQLPESTGYGLGQSVLGAGLWMAPAGLMMMVFAPVSSKLMTQFGARRTLATGALVLSGGYVVAFALMGAPWQLLLASCVASAGVGIGYAAMPTLVLDAVDPRTAGSAVGVNALMRSVGTTLAAAVMVSILTSSTTTVGGFTVPSEGAFQACFVVGALAALLGACIVFFIPEVKRTVAISTPEKSRVAS